MKNLKNKKICTTQNGWYSFLFITEKQDNLTNWDDEHNTKYTELMAYWDMLETGRDFHTGKMYNWGTLSKKKAQKDFDANKDTFIADYLQQYGRVS
mgnify:CR=1 FL=1